MKSLLSALVIGALAVFAGQDRPGALRTIDSGSENTEDAGSSRSRRGFDAEVGAVGVPAPASIPEIAVGGAATSGPALYALHCSPCHGERGRGDGPAGRFLDPAPRDFTTGPFRFITTTNGIPSDTDLYEVISAGLPGTGMLGFPRLKPEDRWALVRVVREFRASGARELYRSEAADEAELNSWVLADTTPGATLAIPPMPPSTVDARARGRHHFRLLCASCHGTDGRAAINPPRLDADGVPIRARDFTKGVLKGGVEPRNFFTRIRLGLPGTAMPSVPASQLDDAAAWDLVHYVRTLVPTGAQDLHDPVSWTLEVPRFRGALPTSPDDPRFLAAPEQHVAFAPFRADEATIPGVLVRAVHDGDLIAFRLAYPDATRDVPADDHRLPPDGLAIRVTSVETPPILPIPGQPLPLDRSLFLAGTMPLEDDAIFDGILPRFANPDGVCKSPIGPEKVGRGVWRDGTWTVVMVVKPERAGAITPGRPMYASFAAFDGVHRRGPMPVAFTAWQELAFAP